MSAIQQWAAALCAAAIGCTMLKTLAPKTGTGRVFHLLLAAFCVCCMASPLLALRSLSLDDLPEVSADATHTALSAQVEQQMKQQMETAVASLCERYLKNYDITVQKVAVHMDTSDDGSIYMSHVTLYLDKQNAAGAFTARQLMQPQLGVTVEVEIQDE